MKHNTADIDHLAKLAKLALEPEQCNHLSKELQNMIHMVNQLQEVNCQDVEPLSHPLEQHQPLRDDNVLSGNQRQQLQQNAPSIDNGYYVVPQIIETE